MTGSSDSDKKQRRLRSIVDRLPERGPVEEEVILAPEGKQARISWPVAFIIATVIVCLTAIYILGRWAEWQCQRRGGVWYPVTEGSQLPDNFCDYPE